MKYIDFYENKLGLKTSSEVFNYMNDNFKSSIKLFTYFVNWEKVHSNVESIDKELNLLNSLVGKQDLKSKFIDLLKEYPQVIPVIPALAVRDGSNSKSFEILIDYKNHAFIYDKFAFKQKNNSDKDIERYWQFVEKTGIIKLFSEFKIKNLVDYMNGVEAGLDSNARKNRGGHAMEEIVEYFIKDLCTRKGFKYLKEANQIKINKELGKDVPVDKSSRRYDFVIDTGNKLYIFETNFYGSGGSKLKSTAGEYVKLNNILKDNNLEFIWITDGAGWKTAKRPLEETFNNNDYILSLKMMEEKILDEIVK